MTDCQRYINALRKCAKEHENDRTSTGHIVVSDLCRDTANLLEELDLIVNKGKNITECGEYRQGWEDAIAQALKETYTIHSEEGTFKVIQEESLIGVGMMADDWKKNEEKQ